MTNKSVKVAIFLTIIALLVVGCGDKQDPNETIPTQDPADTAEPTEEPTEEPIESPTVEDLGVMLEEYQLGDKVDVDQDAIQVTVNTDNELFVSSMQLGTTHTHYFWERGHSGASARARSIFESYSVFNNQHIMGWGADNPWPEQDGPMDFTSLDYRITLMESLGGEPMITLCQAPGWMKGQDDWAMEAGVLEEYMDDFAYLSAAIAERYPDVKYFQVWNEFKGYWSSEKNEWDYELYTKLYNVVYKAVKEVRPDALVGGFYMVIEGDASRELLGTYGTHDYTPLDSFQKRAINYWLDSSLGADFICLDMGLLDHHNELEPTAEQTMVLTQNYANVIGGVVELTDLPIVMSEYYGSKIMVEGSNRVVDKVVDAAQYAGMLKHMLIASEGRDIVPLIWLEKENDLTGNVFSDTDISSGGIKYEPALVLEYFTENFSKGKTIVQASANSDDVIVLASKEKVMVINATDSDIKIQINETEVIDLSRFEVKYISQ